MWVLPEGLDVLGHLFRWRHPVYMLYYLPAQANLSIMNIVLNFVLL